MSEEAPAYKLHGPEAVGLASFLGTPIAGGILLGLNYERLGRPRVARTVTAATILATTGGIVYAFVENPIGLLWIAFLGVLLMHTMTRQFLRWDLEKHVRRGGELASLWSAVKVGLLCGAGVSVVLVAAAVLTGN